jgi:hypothetical protein
MLQVAYEIVQWKGALRVRVSFTSKDDMAVLVIVRWNHALRLAL